MIQVEGLSKVYGTVLAVQDLSFSVGPGEILGLVGPNGAGKTTTLRSLAGIICPTRGRLVVAGHDMSRDGIRAKAELAFVPDEPQLFEYLTVTEHLLFTARLYQQPESAARIPDLLRELELADKSEVLASELSRGMKQKLAIACGLMHAPRVLMLDEPLTGLDPVGIRRMKRTIAQRARDGAAVILSSHLLQLVEELCTHVLIIQGGRRVAFGTLEEIIRERPDLAGRGLEEIFLSLTGHQGEAGT